MPSLLPHHILSLMCSINIATLCYLIDHPQSPGVVDRATLPQATIVVHMYNTRRPLIEFTSSLIPLCSSTIHDDHSLQYHCNNRCLTLICLSLAPPHRSPGMRQSMTHRTSQADPYLQYPPQLGPLSDAAGSQTAHVPDPLSLLLKLGS